MCILFLGCVDKMPKTASSLVDPDTMLLGEISGPVNFNFVIKSVGSDTLKILKFASSCGCTKVDLNKKAIAPGDSADMTGTYTPEVAGPFEKTIVLNLNTREKFKVLRIKGICDSLPVKK
jgi:hypothetical protein